MRAYTPSVTSPYRESQPQSAATSARMARRRRPPDPEEHARRIAWGRKWGRLVSEATAAWREEGK